MADSSTVTLYEWVPPGARPALAPALGAVATSVPRPDGPLAVSDVHWASFLEGPADEVRDHVLVLVTDGSTRDPGGVADAVVGSDQLARAIGEAGASSRLGRLLRGLRPESDPADAAWLGALDRSAPGPRVGLVRPPAEPGPDGVAAALLAGLLRTGLRAPAVTAGVQLAFRPSVQASRDDLALDAILDGVPIALYDGEVQFVFRFDPDAPSLALVPPDDAATDVALALVQGGERFWAATVRPPALDLPLAEVEERLRRGPLSVILSP